MLPHVTRVLCSTLALSLVSGCLDLGNHVELRSPPQPTAPLAERTEAYEELRPRTQVDTVLVKDGRPISEQPRFIMLRDGRRVYRPEDLATVVPAQSPTAQAAHRSERAADRIRTWQIAGITIGSAGLATALINALTFPSPGADSFDTHIEIGGASILIMGLGLAVAVHGTLANASELTDERTTAFALYDADLKKGLDLCVSGTSIVECEPTGGRMQFPGQAAPFPGQAAPFPAPAAPPPAPAGPSPSPAVPPSSPAAPPPLPRQ